MLVGQESRPDAVAGIVRFRNLVTEKRRDPTSVPISLFLFSRPSAARLERDAPLGFERLVLSPPIAGLQDPSATLRHLDEVTPIVEERREP